MLFDISATYAAMSLRGQLRRLSGLGITHGTVKDRQTGQMRDVSIRSLDAACQDVIDAVWEDGRPDHEPEPESIATREHTTADRLTDAGRGHLIASTIMPGDF